MPKNAEALARLLAPIPLGQFATPNEISQAAVWLCSDSASYVVGHTMVVDGGHIAQ